ncbi:MAG: hypothetical protein ACSHX6_16205 [Akkermansiaceae bacterium]
MNKFIISSSILSFGLLASCSTISGYRQDPDTWGKKGKKEKVQKVSTSAERPKLRPVTQPQPSNIAPAVVNNNVNRVSKKTAQKGRTIEGMIEPNVTKLPDNKDLQESNNIAPIPVQPKLESPVAPLLPNDFIDPTSPLPSDF